MDSSHPVKSLEPVCKDHVVLVSEDGNVQGTADRLEIHSDATPLHLAFSTYLFDPQGRLLISRRALDKKTWPGVWTNSACGHIQLGENPIEAALRRATEELGVEPSDLRLILPNFRYRAIDASGIVENELCPVMVGRIDSELSVDPGEIAEYDFVEWDDYVTAVRATPAAFSPWTVMQIEALGGSHPLSTTTITTLDEFKTEVDKQITGAFDSVERLWQRSDVSESSDFLPLTFTQWGRELAASGGKRIRTEMVWWGFVGSGGLDYPARLESAACAAAAVEILHVFALIHDDVMDRSLTRRGDASAHVQARQWHQDGSGSGDSDLFGESIAILLADYLHALADYLASGLSSDMRELWYLLCFELIDGQLNDLTGSAAKSRKLETATQVADLKSGAYTVLRPLELGAAAAQADDETLASLREFGVALGRAFAWRDDVLGVWGDEELSGKPAGDDLVSGKPTVIAALASERLSAEWQSRFDSLSESSSDTEVRAIAEQIESLGVRTDVEHRIEELAEKAKAELESGRIDERALDGLTAAIEKIAWRQA